MENIILLCIGLIVSVCFLVLIAQKVKIAYPIFLVLAGLMVGLIPVVPIVHIDPQVVFLVILPPILYDASQNMSLKGLWKWRRIITAMAFGFVLFTATAVAFVSYWLIPGFTLAQGFLLGAIISPPDAAAATAILRFAPLPKGAKDILEGESLLNDATSLTLFRVALAAISTNHFVWYEAAGSFIWVTVAGIAIGLAFGFLFYMVYKWLPTTANIDTALTLVIPYAIYLTAEEFHVSGVLAVVSGGLYIAYQHHFVFSHKSRLKSGALWSAIVFILNAIVFFLIGLQFPLIAKGIQSLPFFSALSVALTICLVVIFARTIAGFFSVIFTRFISRYITVAYNKPGWRNPLVLSWVGMRGVVSLASALAIPFAVNGQAFPNRNLILFITFTVVIVTLVGQGLALPWIIRKVKPDGTPVNKTEDEQIFELEIALNKTAVSNMQATYHEHVQNNILLKQKYEFLKHKTALLYKSNEGDSARKQAMEIITQFKAVMLNVSEKERSVLHSFRRHPDFDDDILRFVEKRLDLEEESLDGNAE
ncbi:Na+/H+ antiporter [Parafilimonas sp.]|uniref:Na+/H+ antiporter n=1 Tax=Parafilimonas sp. TaxID=1969739 RepID=UPI0039E5C7E0